MNTELFDQENWNNLLASYVIDYWLDSVKSELPDWSDVLNLLGLEETENSENQLFKLLGQGELSSSLIQELELEVKEISGSLEDSSLENIIGLEEEIFSWYYGNPEDNTEPGCVASLELNFQELKNELRDKNQQFLNDFWSSTSPRPCLKYLSKVEAFLLNLSQQYQIERQSYLKKENGGQKSYAFLYSKMIKSDQQKVIQESYKAIINALLHIYRCKIKAQILTLAIQIIQELIRDNQAYVDNLIKSVSFLRRIKDSCVVNTNQPSNFIIAMIFGQICVNNSPEVLCKELETNLGCSLNRWGSCGYISEAEVKKMLLNKIAGITNSMYEEIKQEFTSNIVVNRDLNPAVINSN
ncbi:MAG: hypothetical protein QNJ60_00285 [Xenococcaceae cyanobacterium MO_188.B19]|nr:hypothetical protein [Xenococcaceae cyanobacterium MO_188.B19]